VIPSGTVLPAAKDTGMRNLPFHDMNQNRIWLAITALATELLAWTARLALRATAALYEPKRLRRRSPYDRYETSRLTSEPGAGALCAP
jgi:hypothetical protein